MNIRGVLRAGLIEHTRRNRAACGFAMIGGLMCASSLWAQPRMVLDIRPGQNDGLFNRSVYAVEDRAAIIDTAKHVLFTRGTVGTATSVNCVPQATTFWGWLTPKALGKRLFVPVVDGANNSLVCTDGTQSGTRSVLELTSGGVFGTTSGLAPAGGVMYFTVATVRGGELWRSDGTAEGTLRLAAGTFRNLAAIGQTMVGLEVTSTGAPVRLWRSDGAPENTTAIVDLAASVWTLGQTPVGVVSGDWYYFVAPSAAGGALWRSDGTPVGTVVIPISTPPRGSIVPQRIVAAPAPGSVYIVTALNGLWYSDGTASGSHMVLAGATNSTVGLMVAAQTKLFFPFTSGGDTRLWVSDGTLAGTLEVADINPSGNDSVGSLATVADRVYFAANDGVHGRELWVSDGTTAGTGMVADTRPGPADGISTASAGNVLAVVNSRLYFIASDGVTGQNPWVLDLCAADFDNDGRTGIQDVFEYLRSFFAGEDLADIDRDGRLNSGDVFAWLTSWFAGCREP